MNGSVHYEDGLLPADLGPGMPGGAYTVAVGTDEIAERKTLWLVDGVLQALLAGTVPLEARERLERILAVTGTPPAALGLTVTGSPAHNPFRAFSASAYGGIR
jgi:hypothetical protein